ncbi:S1 family peptidase [Prauserella cavernicola]|uniref:Serine protease n=1 Tax=Prauserella cavernicola TaxID=2800127 RepID=A0A934QPP2_9PSEU|nr:serine protease [Prauserella cavernicola]MBK1783768.1 serine protease [Prauserella cavernicola]
MRWTRVTAVLAGTGAILAGLTSAAGASDSDAAVIGGDVADGKYPFIVNLTLDGPPEPLHRCGASLVSPTWAVTAAHCVAGVDDLTQLTARVGSNDRTEGGEQRRVVEKVVHPGYGEGEFVGDDVALVRLAEPVDAEPIDLADATATDPGADVRMLGWGSTCQDPVTCPAPEKPRQLHQLDTRVVAPELCTDRKTDAELCVGERDGGVGACHGDSGGPLLVRTGPETWSLAGATSRSGQGESECAEGPALFTSVAAYSEWIDQVVDDRDVTAAA